MSFKRITVIGGGVLGSQIAFQSAFKGFDVTIYMRSEASIGRSKPKFDRWKAIYTADLEAAKTSGGPVARGYSDNYEHISAEECERLLADVEKAYVSLKFETDLAKSLEDADLVIEALSENLAQKQEFYAKAAPLLPEKTVVVSNSSTLLPSLMAPFTGRPEKFLALHFANEIWANNLAEVMGHAGTNPACFEQVYEFALQIGMIPVRVKKEQPAYLLNTQLVPIAFAAAGLVANEVADPADVDKAWTLGTGSGVGILHFLDIVGMDTVYNIGLMMPGADDPDSLQYKTNAMLKKMIDEGRTGTNAGEGFFKY